MAKTAIVLYTLITVTGNGHVDHSTGFKSLHLCQEARSLALNGMSIEEKQSADDARAKQEKAEYDAFIKSHPPRPPKTDFEKAEVKNRLDSKGPNLGAEWGSTDGGEYVTKEGLIQETPPLLGSGWISADDPNAVKIAECVIEP